MPSQLKRLSEGLAVLIVSDRAPASLLGGPLAGVVAGHHLLRRRTLLLRAGAEVHIRRCSWETLGDWAIRRDRRLALVDGPPRLH